MSSIEKWNRNSFGVEAAQITDENMEEIAQWCSGIIKIEHGSEKSYVLVTVDEGSRAREAKAYVGEWVVITDDDRLALYTNDELFRKDFQQYSILKQAVHDVITEAMHPDSSETRTSGAIRDDNVGKIMRLFSGEK